MKLQHQNSMMLAARKIFLAEVEQRLPQSLDALASLRAGNYDPAICETLYRFAHTLKGSGQMVNLRDIAEPAAEMATALLLVRDYGTEVGEGLLKFLTDRMEEIEAETARLGEEKAVSPREQPIVSGGKKILVVDDDPTITGLVKERLQPEGFIVTVCHTASEAETHLQAEQPDLILLDIVMPGEDGIQFCRRLRTKEHENIIPIIFFTVKGELQDKLVGFATGADDYLAKPFELEELVARIQTLLDRIELFQGWSWRDELTKVYNRRYLDRRLQEELARAQRKDETFSLAMLDIDLFKNINDSYGHTVGDEVLRLLAARMTEALRANDLVFRYGGDEFVVIFPATSLSEALIAIERIRETVAAKPIILPNSDMVSFTISAGVASFPEEGRTGGELVAAADAAMYRAKEAGRNLTLPYGRR